jgi:hypothetical protein
MAQGKGSISFNAASFLGGFKKFTDYKMPNAIGKAQFQTGWMVIRYANTKKPYTPRDKSDLQASGRVEVVPTSKIMGATVASDVIVGFNKEYAAKLHEMPKGRKVNWTLPGSGRKYLETKLYHYKRDFMRFMAEIISKLAFK